MLRDGGLGDTELALDDGDDVAPAAFPACASTTQFRSSLKSMPCQGGSVKAAR